MTGVYMGCIRQSYTRPASLTWGGGGRFRLIYAGKRQSSNHTKTTRHTSAPSSLVLQQQHTYSPSERVRAEIHGLGHGYVLRPAGLRFGKHQARSVAHNHKLSYRMTWWEKCASTRRWDQHTVAYGYFGLEASALENTRREASLTTTN